MEKFNGSCKECMYYYQNGDNKPVCIKNETILENIKTDCTLGRPIECLIPKKHVSFSSMTVNTFKVPVIQVERKSHNKRNAKSKKS